ncbi:MAG: hypothetical protein U1F11_09005 [Steroidobacteraceae bacterium]
MKPTADDEAALDRRLARSLQPPAAPATLRSGLLARIAAERAMLPGEAPGAPGARDATDPAVADRYAQSPAPPALRSLWRALGVRARTSWPDALGGLAVATCIARAWPHALAQLGASLPLDLPPPLLGALLLSTAAAALGWSWAPRGPIRNRLLGWRAV